MEYIDIQRKTKWTLENHFSEGLKLTVTLPEKEHRLKNDEKSDAFRSNVRPRVR